MPKHKPDQSQACVNPRKLWVLWDEKNESLKTFLPIRSSSSWLRCLDEEPLSATTYYGQTGRDLPFQQQQFRYQDQFEPIGSSQRPLRWSTSRAKCSFLNPSTGPYCTCTRGTRRRSSPCPPSSKVQADDDACHQPKPRERPQCEEESKIRTAFERNILKFKKCTLSWEINYYAWDWKI